MRAVEADEPTVQRQRGRRVVRVAGYDPATGRRKVRQLGTFPTRREAAAFARSVGEGRAGGDDETLAAYLEQVWLPAKEGRVAVATYDQYRWAVARHIVPLIGAVRMRDLTAEVIDDWLVALSVAPEGGKARLAPRPVAWCGRCCPWRSRRPPSEADWPATRWS